jgi:hypothetical protein
MFDKIKAVITQLLTGRDNTTHDLARWSMLMSMLGLFGLCGWKCYKHNDPSLMEFAGAAATIVTGHCAGVAVKAKTEPDGDDK